MTERRVWSWFGLGFVLVLVALLTVLSDASWTGFLVIVWGGTLAGLSIFAYIYAITHAWRRFRDGWVVAIVLFYPALALLYLLLHAREPMLASRPEQKVQDPEDEPETRSWLNIGLVVVTISIVFVALSMPVTWGP